MESALRRFGLIPFVLMMNLAACTSVDTNRFSVMSDAFSDGGMIPSVYTCDGPGTRPLLRISNVPDGTVSLAIIVEDPDVPSGIFTHWAAWNIDPKLTVIAGDDPLPGAVEGYNGSKTFGYKGPCPPTGAHHYHFRVFAVNRTIDLPAASTPDQLKNELKDYVITQADLVGLYERVPGTPSPETESGTKTLPGSTVLP